MILPSPFFRFFFADASAFLLAFSAFLSSLYAYFHSASIESLPVKPVKFNSLGDSFFVVDVIGSGGGGGNGGPFPGGGLTSCFIGVLGSSGITPRSDGCRPQELLR